MDYSELPDAVLKKIAIDHLETLSEHIAFSQVCKSWRSTATDLLRRRRHRHHGHGRPGLLISHKSKPPLRTPLEFFPIGDPTLPLIPTRPSLWPPPPPPPPATKAARKIMNRRLQEQSSPAASFSDKLARNQCVGSKDGWLLLLHPGNRRRRNSTYLFSFYLYNPITAAHVTLPDLTLENDENEPPIVRTVISSSSPDDDEQDCHVFIVFKRTLAWSTVGPGRPKWKLASLYDLDMNYVVMDASYSGGKLFLVGQGNRFVIVDILVDDHEDENVNDHRDANRQIMVKPCSRVFYLSREMISSSSDRGDESRFSHLCHLDKNENDQFPLVVISRCTKDDGIAFRLYKLVLLVDPEQGGVCSGSDGIEWKEVTGLNGCSVFLGSHQSFTLSVAEDGGGVNYGVGGANRIYFSFSFSEHHLYMDHAMFWSCHHNNCGVFKLDGGEVEWFDPCRHLGDHSYVWFLPSPWQILRYMHERKAKKPDRLLRKEGKRCDN